MSETEIKSSDTTVQGTTESLLASFHHVQSLIPIEQELVVIPPEMRVADALKLMQLHHYSQLPVVAGDTVLGVFSYRSFSAKAWEMQKRGERLGELPVEDFLDYFEYVHSTEDWNRVMRYLNQDDACFVGHRNHLEGMITTMDMLHYFQQIANPFIMLAEVELSLRQIIQVCIDGQVLRQAVERSLKSAYPNGVPTKLSEMTFNDYAQIITSMENWPYFEKVFGTEERTRKDTEKRLSRLREWRNIIFHFRRRLEEWELNALAEYREWLQVRVRAYEGRQRTAEKAKVEPVKGKRSKTSREELTTASDRVGADFFNWMIDQAQARGMIVEYGTRGFSVRLKRPDRLISFAYGYPPNIFEAYLDYLELPESEILAWRRELLTMGVLQEVGEKTLRAFIKSNTIERLQEAYIHLLQRVVAIGRYPLPIRAIVQGKEITAELLDENGRIRFDGVVYSSPSGAGKAASGWIAVNGWTFWQYHDLASSDWKAIDALRRP
jgi:predicted transcriptional regulator